jgi:hypothetical protein
MSFRPHAQRNQYKDTKEIGMHMRNLYHKGVLNELQASMYHPTRPIEELYNLEDDPYEVNNLANDQKYQKELENLKSVLYKKMQEINDPGLIPEPILEDLGKEHGNKYTAMKQSGYEDVQQRLIKIIEAGEKNNTDYLMEKAYSKDAAERYWAVTWLGVNKAIKAREQISNLMKDDVATVRIAALLAGHKINPIFNPISGLSSELFNDNLIEGMYAMNAVEQSGIRNKEVMDLGLKAMDSKYEFTRRFGKYLYEECSLKK